MAQATSTEIRGIFDSQIAQSTGADRIAKLEVLREYFTNPAFRAQLEEATWNNR